MSKLTLLILIFLGLSSTFLSQENNSLIKALGAEELNNSNVIPGIENQETGKIMACAGNAANDNFANAQSLTVNGGLVAGTTCGTSQAGETSACNAAGNPSVWYKFTATATTHYVQIAYVSGSCYFGSAIYGGSTLPTSACGNTGPISCQASSGGPLTHLYHLTNLTVGATYYIQIIYPAGGSCGTNGTFNIQVTTANPGGTITNPPPLTSCTSPGAGCFFNSPPASAATVTAACTSYSLAANGYSANSVWSTVIQFTSSASWSNFSWQAIITSNCSGGNVHWLNWTLFDCSCNQLACGNLSTLTGNGLACGTCYRLKYELELANCSTVPLNINPPNFTNIYPYQNIPSSPTPCTVLPLHLLYFTAFPLAEDKKVNIEWESVVESNVKNYRIERSDDGINFNLLSVIEAKGTKNGNQKYFYEDKCCVNQETRYYKLTSIDNDGTKSYEKIIAVTFNNGNEIAKFAPNPASSNFIISFGEKAQLLPTKVQVFNTMGQLVMEEEFVTNTFFKQFNIVNLNSGLYYVNLITPVSSEVIKYKLIKE